MLRITVSETMPPGRTRVLVEGRLTGEKMEQLDVTLETLPATVAGVMIDLAGVSFADATGIDGLRRARGRGAELVDVPPLLAEMLRSAEPSLAAGRHDVAAEDGDGELLAALRAGDDGAYETMLRRFGPRLLATAKRLVKSEDDAHDVLQEAYVAAFRGIDRFAGGARLSTWLHRIVVNAALMRLRSRRRRPESAIDDLLPGFDETGHFVDSPGEWAEQADALIERRQTRDMVRRAIERLPDGYREVLILRDIEGLDTEETARAIGMSANATKIRLHRARQALRTLIEKDLGRSS